MLITATKNAVRVQFRKPGKTYAHQFPEGGAPVNTDTHSDYPHDEVDLQVGESFDASGMDIKAIREFTPTVDHGNDTSMAG